MAETATEKLDPSPGTKSRARTVKVVHIGNPTMVTASQSDFRAVVQSLTGKKRKSSPSASRELNWGCDESIRVKEPKLSGGCPITNTIPQPAITHHMPAISTDTVYISEAQESEMMPDIYTHPMFDTSENLGDAIYNLFQIYPQYTF